MDYLKTIKIGDPLTSLIRPPEGGIAKKRLGFQETAQKTPSPSPGYGNFTKGEIELYRQQNERIAIRNILKEREASILLSQPILEREQRKQRGKKGLINTLVRKALSTGLLKDIETFIRSAGTEDRKAEHLTSILKKYEAFPAEDVKSVYQDIEGRVRDSVARGEPRGSVSATATPVSFISDVPIGDKSSMLVRPKGNAGALLTELKGRLSRLRSAGEAESKEAEEEEPVSAFRRPRPPPEEMKPSPPGSRAESRATLDPEALIRDQISFSKIRDTLPLDLEPEEVSALSGGSRSKLRKAYEQAGRVIPEVLRPLRPGRPRKP